MPILPRLTAVIALLGLLAACDTNNLKDPPVPMGDFAMGLNVVVEETAQTVPISRKAKPGEWKDAMTKAMSDRFGSYSGARLFNFGISIDGYELAPPGVPILASPKSALIATVNVWDDATQKQFNPGGKRLTIVEGKSLLKYLRADRLGIQQILELYLLLRLHRLKLQNCRYWSLQPCT